MKILKIDKDGKTHYELNGKKITDQVILDYIRKLVIPPKYKDVVIFYEPEGEAKILYQGYDSKQRLQRIYSSLWNNKTAYSKFCELLNFAEQIEKIIESIKHHIPSKNLTIDKCIAMVIKIIMVCYFRIGNKKYQDLYGSFGAMNILKKHVTYGTNNSKEFLQIKFVGKKGMLNSCEIYDKELIDEIKHMTSKKKDNDYVFEWDDRGTLTPLKAIDVNDWLKKFDTVITSKDFRTYDANIFLIIFLRKQIEPGTLTIKMRKKIIIEALRIISEKIHNTPNILKKNYTQYGILDMYINEPIKFKKYFLQNNTPKQSLVNYLKDYCKSGK